jgi:hypothetical protein
MSRRRRHHARRILWLAACPLAAFCTVGQPYRWPAAAGAGLVVLVIPLVMKASMASVAPVLVPRRVRMARRHDRPRPPIPRWLRKAVYAADRYRCVYCASRLQLQLDHVIPWSFGGLTVLWNLVTLCGRCNRIKSNYWKSDTGQVYYRPFRNAASKGMAGMILRRELRTRRNPVRWVRAARTWYI